jgi:hypothetical protein
MAIKVLLSRINGISFKRMWKLVNEINKESCRSRTLIILDMFWCAFFYGMGYLEYRVFGFIYIRGKKRKTFMTCKQSIEFIKKLNNKKFSSIFEDKVEFNKKFNKYINRKWLDLRKSNLEEFYNFLNNKKHFFAKVLSGCGGKGIEKINLNEFKDYKNLYKILKEKQQFLVEETLVQNKEISVLSPSSMNTIRIVTVVKDSKVIVIYSLVRIGDGSSSVDNISSGGMYCPVDDNGVIGAKAFCDKTGKYYENHPLTRVKFSGFKIPLYKEAVNLVKKAALEVPEVKYVGWDVAICEEGPALIEGNTIPGYDMCQNYYHLGKEKIGILPKFRKILDGCKL